MIGMTNTEGIGLSDDSAILRVQAPAGSLVTITKGNISKSDPGHENMSDPYFYDYYFIIHYSQFDAVNPWTVTAILESNIVTKTIIIKEPDAYNLELQYKSYLYQAGDQDGWDVKAWKAHSQWTATAPTMTYGPDSLDLSVGFHSGIAYHVEKIDLTHYNTVTAHGTIYLTGSSSIGNGLYILPNVDVSGIYQDKSVATAEIADVGDYVNYDLIVDVTSLIGEYYVVLGITHGNGNQYSYTEVYVI